MVLTDQLDRSMAADAAENKELQRKLDRNDHEVSRLQDRVREGEERVRELQSRHSAAEREVLNLQDTIFKRDRTIKDLNGKIDSLNIQRDEARASLEDEIDSIKHDLSTEKQRYSELVQSHRKEMADIQREIEKRLPSLAADVAAQAEAHFTDQLSNEVSSLQAKHQRQIEGLKQEMYELQSKHSETVSRLKASSSDEKIEFERLRQKCQLLESRNNDMEVMVESMRQKERQQMLQIQWGGPANNPPPTSDSFSTRGGDVDLSKNYHPSFQSVPNVKGHRTGSGRGPDASVADDDSLLERFVDGEAMNSISDELAEMRKQLTQSLNRTTLALPRAERASRDTGRKGVDESSDNSSVYEPLPTSYLSSHRGSAKHNKSPARHRSSNISHRSKSHGKRAEESREAGGERYPSLSSRATDRPSSPPPTAATTRASQTPRHNPVKTAYSPEALFNSPAAPRQQHSFPLNQSSYEADVSVSMLSHDPNETIQSRYYEAMNRSSSHQPMTTSSSFQYNAPQTSSKDFSRSPGHDPLSLIRDVDFSAIQDGGYHEGYWRAKYLRGSS